MAVTEKLKVETGLQHNYRKQKITAAIGVTLLFAFAVYSLLGIRYRTNDDAIISNIIAGGYGGETTRAVYVNVIFAALLQPLYKIYFANWYVIVRIFLMLVSISVILYLFMKKLDLAGLLLGLSVLFSFGAHVLYSFQYTKVSFILITAGLLLITDGLGKINLKTAFGIFLVLTGSMIRFSSFYAAGGMCAALLLYNFAVLNKQGKKYAVVTMITMFSLVFGAKIFDSMAYRTNADWLYFTEYNKARTQFSDFVTLSLPEENIFADKGISDVDYAMLKNWDFYDSEKFTPRLLNSLSDYVQPSGLKETFSNFIHNINRMLMEESFNILLAVIIVLSIVYFKLDFAALPLLGCGGIFRVLILYLSYKIRFPSWVEVGMIWTFICYTVYSFGALKRKKQFNTVICGICLLLSLISSVPDYFSLYSGVKDYNRQIKQEQHYFDAMSRDKQNIYLMSTLSTNNTAGMDVFNPKTDNYYSNIVTFGGWISAAPHRTAALAQYGLVRPIVDAVDNPKVYFDYHHIENVRRYARQELGKEVYIVSTGDIEYAPYQLTTEKPL